MSQPTHVPGACASIQLAPTQMGGQIVTLNFPTEGGTMYLPGGQAITFAPKDAQVPPSNRQVALVDEDVARAYGVYESDYSTASESSDSVLTAVEDNVSPASPVSTAGGHTSEAGSNVSEAEDEVSEVDTVENPDSPSLTETEAIFGEAFMSDDEWEEYYTSKAYKHNNTEAPEGNDRSSASDEDIDRVIDVTQNSSSEDSVMEDADDASDSSEDAVVVPGRKRATQHNTPKSVVKAHNPPPVQYDGLNEAGEFEGLSDSDEDSDEDSDKDSDEDSDKDSDEDSDKDSDEDSDKDSDENHSEYMPDKGSDDEGDTRAPKHRTPVVNYAEELSDDEEMEDAEDDAEDDNASVSSETSEKTVVPEKHAQDGVALDYDEDIDDDPVMPNGRRVRARSNTSKPVPDVVTPSGSDSDAPTLVTADADPVNDEASPVELNMDIDMEEDFDQYVEQSYFDQLAGKRPRSPSEWSSFKWTSQRAIDGRFSGADQGPGSPFANFDPSIPRGPMDVPGSPFANPSPDGRDNVQEIAGEIGFKRHWGQRMPNTPTQDRLPILTDEPARFKLTKGELKMQALRRMHRYDPQTMEQFLEIQPIVEAKESSVKSDMARDGSNETSVEGCYEHENAALESNHGREFQGVKGFDQLEDSEEHGSAELDEEL
ncbi:uncharacterized protein N0V89_009964 [Didymosphaeria variabile]|uniref:Uncharacterized protein n=1 Tax=Didymosphaeria variabile TaxID=1932322 RepID=A0A9W8XEB8_9PLEO|nr:uncharacterized protein N0V89_009964 [Didymosphaeria variabile]KAJ4348586.1 hypothetical protein N0V89_009964 [Didymosphaeria variabile]